MPDFESILNNALELTAPEKLQLISALWDAVPDDADSPLHPEWEAVLDRRAAEVDAGTAKTVPWAEVRDASRARLRDDATR